jgi:hypothetical protein
MKFMKHILRLLGAEPTALAAQKVPESKIFYI